MAKYEYPIKADYIRNWNRMNAFRELIANAKDADKAGYELKIDYDTKKEVLTLINKGVTLTNDALLLGGTTKHGDSAMIGQYGEGLKLALLVFARENVEVKIRNGRNETWTPAIEWSEKWKANVLVITSRQLAKPRDLETFEVEIPGVSLELFQEVENLFLFLFPATTIDTPDGQILTDAEHVGKIYVKGVLATYVERYSTGYNFYNLDTGRDRQIPARWQMDDAIGRMWADVAEKHVEHADTIYDMMVHGKPEGDVFLYSSNEGVLTNLASTFKRRHGEKAVPVISVGDAEQIKHLGYEGVVVPSGLARQLHKKMSDAYALTAKHQQDVTERFGPKDLTKGEAETLRKALFWFDKVIAGAAHRVVVATFREPSIEGLHKEGEILLARTVLSDFGHTLMVLAHEFAHDEGGDGTLGHVDRMQNLVQDLFNAMSRALEEKTA